MTATRASTLCRRELALLEGTVLRWYRDATGTWTCCTGHTAAAGPPVYAAGQTFTSAQSDAICAADLARVYEPAMARLIKVPLTQYEWDGVELLTYNIGEGNLAKSDLLRHLNAGDKAAAADGFGHFTTSHGQQLPGLVKRRATERTIFLTGQYPGLKPEAGHSGAEMAAAVTLASGMTGDAVAHLQGELKLLGFFAFKADGIFGPMTKHAVQAFQRAHGLSDDGVAGLKTGLAITAALDAKAKAAGAVAVVVLPKPAPLPTSALVLPPVEPGPIKDLVLPTKAAAAPIPHGPSLWARIRFLFTGAA